jgi:hypothetical protein
MPGRHGAFKKMTRLALMAKHLFVKHANGVGSVGRATHSSAAGHTAARAAGQQSQWRGNQSDDHEDGLSAAHIEP